MGFSGQEYWSGLPFPSPENLPNPGIKPTSPALAGKFFTAELPGKPNPYVHDIKDFSYLNYTHNRMSYSYWDSI